MASSKTGHLAVRGWYGKVPLGADLLALIHFESFRETHFFEEEGIPVGAIVDQHADGEVFVEYFFEREALDRRFAFYRMVGEVDDDAGGA
jgi:hypothetical protein